MEERVCPVSSDQITRAYFDSLLLEMRHIDAVEPDTTLTLYGETFATPVMMAALSHLKGQGNEGDGMVQMAEGAKMAGAVNWAGMGDCDHFDRIAATGARSIKIIKPYADEKEVLTRIERAEEAGALAVGMDVDHAFAANGHPDRIHGLSMRPRTMEEMAAYVKRTHLPFIVKGVLSVTDAKKCLQAGVKGIVVSHHHNLMPSAVAPLMILPDIVKAVEGAMPVFVDCGVQNGADVLKALLLGATAVSVGRPVIDPILERGAQGAAETIGRITDELRGMMARTATPDLMHMDPSLLWTTQGRPLLDR